MLLGSQLYNINQGRIMSHSQRDIQQLAKALQSAQDSLIFALENLEADRYLIQDDNSVMSEEHNGNGCQDLNTEFANISIFDKIPDFPIDESLQPKITNLKMTQFTPKRKDQLFKKFRKDQEERLSNRKKQIQKNYNPRQTAVKFNRSEFTLRNQPLGKTQTFPVTLQDMDKLKPEADLNDTIVGNYIKLFNFVFIPSYFEDRCYFYSSFFIGKLLGQLAQEEEVCKIDSATLVGAVREKVRQNYKSVKRWNKKIDIFEQDAIVLPINAFKHWFCVIILNPRFLLTPGGGRPQIIYCDSMFEKREFMIQTIRQYIQYEVEEKKGLKVELNEETFPCYQLLLPRQTNTHDCGLYMLSYIEELISRRDELQNLHVVANRRKLQLFPRTLIYTMRERLRKLFGRLINAQSEEEKNDILAEYKGQKEKIIREADLNDYDQLHQKEYKKYQKMNIGVATGNTLEQRAFLCQIRFYLDPDINFYEKDK